MFHIDSKGLQDREEIAKKVDSFLKSFIKTIKNTSVILKNILFFATIIFLIYQTKNYDVSKINELSIIDRSVFILDIGFFFYWLLSSGKLLEHSYLFFKELSENIKKGKLNNSLGLLFSRIIKYSLLLYLVYSFFLMANKISTI